MEECTRPTYRCFRLPVASVPAFGRPVACLLSSGSGSLRGAFAASASREFGADGRHACEPHAKSAGSDEPARAPGATLASPTTPSRDQRYYRSDRGWRSSTQSWVVERNPFTLAKLRHERIKASEEVIAKSLVGDYPDRAFVHAAPVPDRTSQLPAVDRTAAIARSAVCWIHSGRRRRQPALITSLVRKRGLRLPMLDYALN